MNILGDGREDTFCLPPAVTWKEVSGPARAGGGWEMMEAGRVITRTPASPLVRIER